jgi:hypothetical protein
LTKFLIDKMYFPFLFHFSANIGPLCWPNIEKIGTMFLITKFLITEFLIAKFLIAEFLTAEFLIAEFLITKFLITKFLIDKVPNCQSS